MHIIRRNSLIEKDGGGRWSLSISSSSIVQIDNISCKKIKHKNSIDQWEEHRLDENLLGHVVILSSKRVKLIIHHGTFQNRKEWDLFSVAFGCWNCHGKVPEIWRALFSCISGSRQETFGISGTQKTIIPSYF